MTTCLVINHWLRFFSKRCSGQQLRWKKIVTCDWSFPLPFYTFRLWKSDCCWAKSELVDAKLFCQNSWIRQTWKPNWRRRLIPFYQRIDFWHPRVFICSKNSFQNFDQNHLIHFKRFLYFQNSKFHCTLSNSLSIRSPQHFFLPHRCDLQIAFEILQLLTAQRSAQKMQRPATSPGRGRVVKDNEEKSGSGACSMMWPWIFVPVTLNIQQSDLQANDLEYS